MVVDIPDQWITDPPSPSAWRVWAVVASSPEQLPIRQIAHRARMDRRTVSRALLELHKSQAPITYVSGYGNAASTYTIHGGSGSNSPRGEGIEPSIPIANDSAHFHGGGDQPVHSLEHDQVAEPATSRPRGPARAVVNNLNSIQRVKNKQLTLIDPSELDHDTKGGVQGGNRRVPFRKILAAYDETIRGRYEWLAYVDRGAQAPKWIEGGTSGKSLADSKLGKRIASAWKRNPDLSWFVSWFERSLSECLEIAPWARGEGGGDFQASLYWILGRNFRGWMKAGRWINEEAERAKREEDIRARTPQRGREVTGTTFIPEDKTIIDLQPQGGIQWQLQTH